MNIVVENYHKDWPRFLIYFKGINHENALQVVTQDLYYWDAHNILMEKLTRVERCARQVGVVLQNVARYTGSSL